MENNTIYSTKVSMSKKVKKIIIGITASIAAYKAAELVRLLCKNGIEVQVVMTKNATRFIQPLTLQMLSQRSVYIESFDNHFESNVGHIQLARWADLILIAPASANFIARFTYGFADDLLTTLCLASNAPIAIAPAMNVAMWRSSVTHNSIQKLKTRCVHVIDPDEGEQACGEIGFGRLVEPEGLLQWIRNFFANKSLLAGRTVIVTAGPTQEALDPVRYISNRSSGKMGYAIAQAAVQLGAQVKLISGPTALMCPHNVQRIDVVTTEEMCHQVMVALPCDIFIGVAAVANYRPKICSTKKIKHRDHGDLTLQLVENPNILKMVACRRRALLTIGFAAETQCLLKHAKEKLIQTGADIIALNKVGHNVGFNADVNTLTLITKDERKISLPEMAKTQLAQKVVNIAADYLINIADKKGNAVKKCVINLVN